MVNTVLFILSAICFVAALLNIKVDLDLVVLGLAFLAAGHITITK